MSVSSDLNNYAYSLGNLYLVYKPATRDLKLVPSHMQLQVWIEKVVPGSITDSGKGEASGEPHTSIWN